MLCASRISDDRLIIGTDDKLLVYNTATKNITHTLTSGRFMSIRKVTDNSFIAIDSDRILLIHQSDTFIISLVNGWVTTDGLQVNVVSGHQIQITYVDNNGGLDKKKRNIRRITLNI